MMDKLASTIEKMNVLNVTGPQGKKMEILLENRLFSKLVGEEDSRIQVVKGSSECKRLDTDDINTCVFYALTP